MKSQNVAYNYKKNTMLLFAILFIAVFLRFFMLLSVPHGLYMDEAAIGYNARLILHTGKDEYNQAFPLFFRSFGDYKAPGYIYLTSVTMALVGDSDFAVRLPSAVAGVLLVLVFYLILRKIIALDKITTKYFQYLPYLGAFLLAISSSAIHFSRGGFETNVALFFFLCALFFALKFYEKKKMISLIVASLFFAGSTYSYQSYRILAPFTFVVILIWYYIKFSSVRKVIIRAFILFALLVFPIIYFTFSANGSARFAGTSTFNEYPMTSLTQKIYTYPMVYLKNYVSFYSYDFIFAYGDSNGRHQVPGVGLLYHWELPFVLIGFIWIFRRKKSLLKIFILALLFLAPIVPSLVVPSPHTLRGLLLIIPLISLTSIGLLFTYNYLPRLKYLLVFVLVLLVSYEFTLYMHNYYFHYANRNALDWGGAYKETIEKVLENKYKYKYFVVDNNIAFARVYFDFYAPGLHPIFVGPTWKKPTNWKDGETLYIRPFYGDSNAAHFVTQVYLPGAGRTIFAQLTKL